MTRRPTIFLASMATAIGVAAGSFFQTGTFFSATDAYALDPVAADELYRELGDSNNILIESGEVLSKVSELATPSVVHIISRSEDDRRGAVEETGSGVIVVSEYKPGKYVVTNRHVVGKAKLSDIEISLHDGRVVSPLQVWTDAQSDLAVLKIPVDDVNPARWADSDVLKIGDMVLAMGSPFGLNNSITYGIISAKGRRSLQLGRDNEVLNQDFLQTDAAINPGNSGGPLIDMHGRVVGINTAIASNSGSNVGVGFSIPSNLTRRVFEQLLRYNRVQRAYLGVRLDADFSLTTARRLRMDRLRGARVERVYADTPAAKADLHYDDVILEFDGILIQDESHLIHLVSLTPVGKSVTVVVLRNGTKQVVQIQLTSRNELEQAAEGQERDPLPVPVKPMGLTAYPLSSGISRQLGLNESTSGAIVMAISTGGSLGRQLRVGDVIVEVAGEKVLSVADLQTLVERHKDTDELLLRVERPADNGAAEALLVIWRVPKKTEGNGPEL